MDRILVKDKLRYFNNGIEVDASGKRIEQSQSVQGATFPPIDKVKAHINDTDKEMSAFVDLVLTNVPEMTHIMAGFLSSTKEMHPTESEESRKRRLSRVVEMSLAELNSIDQNDLMSIDPKCSDLASRVIKCIAGKRRLHCAVPCLTSAMTVHHLTLLFLVLFVHSIAIETFHKKSKAPKTASSKSKSTKKARTIKNAKQKDDDLPLIQVYKRSKKAAGNGTKKKAQLPRKQSPEQEQTAIESELPDSVKQQSKLGGRKSPDTSLSRPPKKRRLYESQKSNPTSIQTLQNVPATSNDEQQKSNTGPHGDLLVKLFLSEEPMSPERGTFKNTKSVSSDTSTLVNNASDDEISAAGVLLGLAK